LGVIRPFKKMRLDEDRDLMRERVFALLVSATEKTLTVKEVECKRHDVDELIQGTYKKTTGKVSCKIGSSQGKMIGKASGRAVAHGALKRVKATPQQVGLDKSARAQNVQGAFRVPAEGKPEVMGRRLVLIDDVLTSGATIDACARALLRAGAAAVDVLVFARVVGSGRAPI